MEEHQELNEELPQEQPQEVYVPRPAWQVWAARIGVVIVILGVIVWLYHIATGGL